MTLPYPPPWMDMQTLCAHICTSENTVRAWVREGILPAPKKVRHTLMWRWSAVDAALEQIGNTMSASPDSEADRIRSAARAATEAQSRN